MATRPLFCCLQAVNLKEQHESETKVWSQRSLIHLVTVYLSVYFCPFNKHRWEISNCFSLAFLLVRTPNKFPLEKEAGLVLLEWTSQTPQSKFSFQPRSYLLDWQLPRSSLCCWYCCHFLFCLFLFQISLDCIWNPPKTNNYLGIQNDMKNYKTSIKVWMFEWLQAREFLASWGASATFVHNIPEA